MVNVRRGKDEGKLNRGEEMIRGIGGEGKS